MNGLTKRRQTEHDLFCKVLPRGGNPYTEPTKNVRLNSKGNDARWVQVMLNYFGYKLIVDGLIGQKSLEAIKDFQQKHNLVADGICGPLTREALKQAQ